MEMKVNEIEIPMPWGHVAGKIWGEPLDPMVLVIHGFMDNAGSFDRLIPLLPTSFCYICIDLPGHGKSSHLPAFAPFFTLNMIILYKLLVLHFKRRKYIILGHSYGGHNGFLFAQLYPEYVEKLIMLDTVYAWPLSPNQFKPALREKLDFYISLEEKLRTRKPPTYSYDEILNKIQNRRTMGAMTREAAEALLPRALIPTGNGRFGVTWDPRLKGFINPIHDFDYIIKIIEKFSVICPVLVVLGRGNDLQRLYMKPITNLLEKYENVTIKVVEGEHDVHNNHPEVVAPLVSEFMLRGKGKL